MLSLRHEVKKYSQKNHFNGRLENRLSSYIKPLVKKLARGFLFLWGFSLVPSSPYLKKDRAIYFIILRHIYNSYPYSRGSYELDNVEFIFGKGITRAYPRVRFFLIQSLSIYTQGIKALETFIVCPVIGGILSTNLNKIK